MVRSYLGAVALVFCWQVLVLQAQFSTVLNVPPTIMGDDQAIGSDTQLNVFAGGEVGSNFHAGAEDFSSTNVQVNVLGGTVGGGFVAYASEVNLVDGEIEGFLSARRSVVNMSGGTIGNTLSLLNDSVANVSGGRALQVGVGENSVANISGGIITNVWPHSGETNITGGYVRTVRTLYSDGTYFEPSIINMTNGIVEGFNLEGNNIVDISGGTISNTFYLFTGGSSIFGQVDVSGGTFESGFYSSKGSLTNITGGTFKSNLTLAGEASISGGSLAGPFAVSGSLQFVGRQFLLDGMDITSSLTPGVPLTVTQRNITLSGLLADGAPFEFNLNEAPALGVDYIVPSATLTITLAAVPEPSSLVLIVLTSALAVIYRE